MNFLIADFRLNLRDQRNLGGAIKSKIVIHSHISHRLQL